MSVAFLRPFFSALLIIAATGLLHTSAYAADSSTENPQRTITVTGQGKLKVKPDTASITAGVVTEADTAREALDKNTEKMQRVMHGFGKLGIAERDLQTSGFSINPIYVRPPRRSDGTRPDPRITGYRVSNSATVVVRDLTKIGGVLDKVVTLGANSVAGPSFFLDEPQEKLDEARLLAVADALRKVKLLAEAAGVELGHILTIREGSSFAAQPRRYLDRAGDMEMKADVPIAPGRQEINATVNLVIAIN